MTTYEDIECKVIDDLPALDEGLVNNLLFDSRRNFNKKIIVLDDDPTGVQTVHDVSVYTDWSTASLRKGFSEEKQMFYILTNSRSFSAARTREVHQEIAQNIYLAAEELKKDFILISRGDSTLRGHYPLETEVLREEIKRSGGRDFDGEIICPFFEEGGRYTVNNIHYVKDDQLLIPVGKTEFAKDKTFAYSESHLGKYIEEKTAGKFKSKNCIYITLKEIRNRDIDSIVNKLLMVENFNKVIVNAVDYPDLKVFCAALIKAMKAGKNYLFRTAASMPKILGNIDEKPLLVKEDLINKKNNFGGVVLVGSHVKKTTMQLEELKHSRIALDFIEFRVERVFEGGGLEEEVEQVLDRVEKGIKEGITMVVYTSRRPLEIDSGDKNKILQISVRISEAVTNIITKLSVRPRFVVAKGGITSSDVGTKALRVKKAKVMGQIKPGIPVWLTGNESKYHELPYIIFPGNVGKIDTLREIVEELS